MNPPWVAIVNALRREAATGRFIQNSELSAVEKKNGKEDEKEEIEIEKKKQDESGRAGRLKENWLMFFS